MGFLMLTGDTFSLRTALPWCRSGHRPHGL